MAIAMTCPGCSASFRLGDELAGKTVRCQKCQHMFKVPAAPALEPPPLEATLVEPPPVGEQTTVAFDAPAPPILATLLEPGPQEEVIDATLAEPASKKKAVPKPVSPPRAKAASAKSQSSGIGCAIAAVAGFLVMIVGVGTVAGIFVAINLAPPNPVAVAPRKMVHLDKKDGFADKGPPKDKWVDKDKGKDGPWFDKGGPFLDKGFRDKGFDKDKEKDGPRPPIVINPLPLDGNGQASFRGQVAGGRKSYKVFLVQGLRYNFHVNGINFSPRIEIDDGLNLPRSKSGKGAVFLAYVPARTSDHTITIVTEPAFANGDFDFQFAESRFEQPINVSLALAEKFTRADSLRIHHPVAVEWESAPFHDFMVAVVAGKQYDFKIDSADFVPIVRIHNAAIKDFEWLGEAGGRRVEQSYQAPFTGILRVRVTSDSSGLGDFTFRVTRRPDQVVEDKPGARSVAFDLDGKYHKDDALTDKDPFDAKLSRTKTYLIPIEAGHSYNIDHRSKDFNAYLTLYDPAGKMVAQDDDSGLDRNARILLDAKTTGEYRLVASDLKKGLGALTLDIAKFKLPVSAAVNVPLVLEKKQVAGSDIVEAALAEAPVPRDYFAWAPDGKAFFLLGKDAMLRRYRYPELVEERNVRLPATIGTLHLRACSEGLVVVRTEAREIWLLDPDSMLVTRRMSLMGGGSYFTSPELPQILSMASVKAPEGPISSAIAWHDPVKNTVAGSGALPAGTQVHALTPDGRFMIGKNAAGKLTRWRVLGSQLIFDGAAPHPYRAWPINHPPLVVSPDGRFVLHVINNNILPKSEILPPPLSQYGIAGYRVNDLSKPAFVIDTGPSNTAATFDPRTGFIYTHCRSKGLMICDPTGKVVRELPIEVKNFGFTSVSRLIAHPDGGKLLAFVGSPASKILLIEVPKELPGAKIVEAKPGNRKVVFDVSDVYKNDDRLAADDPREDKSGPFKTYLVPMEAGFGYNIDQKSVDFEPLLKLLDPTGKAIALDTKSGGLRHARILIDPKASGEFRLHASTVKGNTGDFTVEVTRVKLPVKEAVNKAVPMEKKHLDSYTIVEGELPLSPTLIHACLFAPDGKAILTLDAEGWLHRLRIPDFTAEHRIFVGKDVKQIHLAADRVLVQQPKTKEAWVIDAREMRLHQRLPFSPNAGVYAAPTSQTVFTSSNVKSKDGGTKPGVIGYDLTGEFPQFVEAPPNFGLAYARSPDGRFVLGKTTDKKVGRWRVNGRRLLFEQAGEVFPQALTVPGAVVSADSQWLLRIVDTKAFPKEEVQLLPTSGQGVLAYRVSDLAKPAFVIDTGARTYAIATDPKSNHIYTHTATKGLLICDTKGNIVGAIPVARGKETDITIRRIFVHPDGGKLLLTGTAKSGQAIYVELPKDLPPVKSVPDKDPPPDPPKPKQAEFPRNFDPTPIRAGDVTVIKAVPAVYWNTPAWRPDGRSFFVAQAQNTILEVDSQDFQILKRRDFVGAEATWIRGGMAWSAEGLLALGCGDKQRGADMQLIVLDPKTLEPKKKIPCPNASLVASAPNLSVAFVGGTRPFGANEPDFLVVDLKSGVVIKPDLTVPVSHTTFRVSPDGKYFFGADGDVIARFRIDGTKLNFEESSKAPAKNGVGPRRLDMSLDGKRVWLLNFDPLSKAGPDILDATDLSKRITTIEDPALAVSFDPLTQAFLVSRSAKALDFVGGDKGVPTGGDWKCDARWREIIMDPRGGALLIVCGDHVYHAQWTTKN